MHACIFVKIDSLNNGAKLNSESPAPAASVIRRETAEETEKHCQLCLLIRRRDMSVNEA